jgi:hypothetical protein
MMTNLFQVFDLRDDPAENIGTWSSAPVFWVSPEIRGLDICF